MHNVYLFLFDFPFTKDAHTHTVANICICKQLFQSNQRVRSHTINHYHGFQMYALVKRQFFILHILPCYNACAKDTIGQVLPIRAGPHVGSTITEGEGP